MRRTASIVVLFSLITAITTSAHAVLKKPVLTPWVRVRGEAQHIKLSPKEERYIAFTGADGRRLQVMDVRTRKVYLVSKHVVGQAFFWAPDGLRLFHRDLVQAKSGIESQIKAFDMAAFKSVPIATYPHATSTLMFDPRDLRMHLLSAAGLHTHKITFPDQRLARWQVAQRNQTGKWLATDKNVVWADEGGFNLTPLQDDGSGIQSYSVSPDGEAITWATTENRVYLSVNGSKPQQLGRGRDPAWHPSKPLVLMAGARMVGDKAVDFDLRVTDTSGSAKYLTYTQGIEERWPAWTPDGGSVIYTKAGTTDLFRLNFVEEK